MLATSISLNPGGPLSDGHLPPEPYRVLDPYALAARVFWIASWLNQVELYFSVVQRKVLTQRLP
jgi:hypothetical protein